MSAYLFILQDEPNVRPYAIAKNKSTKKMFEQLRNMKKFRCKKYDDVNEIIDRFNPYYKSIYSKMILHLSTLVTVNEFNIRSHVDILLTWEEEERVVTFYDKWYDKFVSETILPNPKYFNKEYKKALKEIGYTGIYKFNNDNIFPFVNESTSLGISISPNSKIVIDEFRLFIKLYGDLMRG